MKKKKWLIIILMLAVILMILICAYIIFSKENKDFLCYSNSDCQIKDAQCGPACYHKDVEPKSNPNIVCEYRPWFKQEKCECINNKCTHVTCEDLGLDYKECDKV